MSEINSHPPNAVEPIRFEMNNSWLLGFLCQLTYWWWVESIWMMWINFTHSTEPRICIVERIRISYFLALSRVARFYATTEQKLIDSFWNALRIRRKINFLVYMKSTYIPKCINVYSIYRTKLGVIGFFVLSFLICF
jgi:Zn-dependent protease with chaperone function